jgi:hypothetical protein
LAVDTITVGCCPLNEVFSVDGSDQMIVEVAALGHFAKECKQERWLVAHGVEVTGGGSF